MVALDALSRREHFTVPDDLVFGNEVGEHLNDDETRDAFYEALDAAGLGHLRAKDEPIVFHDLRHTFGTQCAAKGIDLRKHPGVDGTRRHPDDDALPALRASSTTTPPG